MTSRPTSATRSACCASTRAAACLFFSGNGVDVDGKLSNPKAPSFLALRKDTGKVAWQSNLPGDRIVEGQWSNPAYAEVGGKGQVIFPGGDGFLRVVTPDSAIGRELVGLRRGDAFETAGPDGPREWTVTFVA